MWPGVDFIVELIGAGSVTPFFFVQVRTTRQGYTGQGKRLRVGVSAGAVRVLAGYPAPTYLAGIDEVQEMGYIVSANGERLSALGSLSTAFPMNAADHVARRTLWEEVRAFWSAPASPKLVSAFVDSDWR